MPARSKQEAVGEIAALDLRPFAERAVRDGRLEPREIDGSLRDYRQFLLLVWVNHTLENREFIVPTEAADKVWHEHILDTAVYRAFCDRLVGRYIDHHPGLDKGTASHTRAVDHTRAVHKAHGANAFSDVYLGVEPGAGEQRPKARKPRSFWKRISGSSCGASAGCGGDSGGGCGGGCGGGD